MIVTVTYVRPPTTQFDTVLTFEGTDEQGFEVTFAADRRVGGWVADVVSQGERPECFVEPWQVLSRRSA